jgi:epoxyqueuosine reductase
VGIARADVPLDVDFERYRRFLDAGMHGEMTFLAEAVEARRALDGDEILAGARSVVCVAMRYARSAADEASDPPVARSIARYARGRDYHNGLRKKLRKLAAFVRSLGTPEAPVFARPLCDTAPVLERAWAARAGLGFIGKNGLVIVPGMGSLFLLGEVVTTLSLEPDTPMAERCGSCTRCLDACPTQAFERPFVLDPRRCVAYLTIEHRGPIEPSLRPGIGEHLFGCDDCQIACPFNSFRLLSSSAGRSVPRSARAASDAGVVRSDAAPRASERFAPHPSWRDRDIAELLALSEQGFRRLTEGSPVHRATRDGLARNAAIVLGNRGTNRDDLSRAAEAHPSPVVREAASWAMGRIPAAVPRPETA